MDVGALLAWYETVKRPLPWRETRDPYAILVAEIMLQQTQAARVVPYYERWLGQFPDPATLAAAPIEEVLRAWSGLGYNSRAVRLQRAAARIDAHGWPEDLRTLPGVGPYTAAAVASFAFGSNVAAVDVNWRRVVHRHGSSPAPTPAVNQAMMDLGATVCTARRRDCGSCPVRSGCAGHPDPHPRRRAPRFEGSTRQLRGRTLAAWLEGTDLPAGAESVMDGLVRDGLVSADRMPTEVTTNFAGGP